MKKLSLLIIVYVCLMYGEVSSQTLPTVEDILSITPLWSYASEDSNFQVLDSTSNLHIDKYTRQRYQDHLFGQGRLYLLETFSSYAGLPFGEGYQIHAIDIDSGEPIWVRHNNYFSGSEHIESAFGGNLRLLPNGDIIMHGKKSIDPYTLDPDCFFCPVYVNPMNHHIDFENGDLISEEFDATDTIKNDFKLLSRHIHSKIEGEAQLKYLIYSKLQDGFLYNILDFYHIDEEAELSDYPVFSYEHNTNIQNGLFNFSYPNSYIQINPNIGVGLFGSIDPEQGKVLTALNLVYFDTSDPFNISVNQTIDLLDKIAQNQGSSPYTFQLRLLGEEVLVTQKAQLDDGENPVEYFMWVSWYDKNGNEIQTIERFQKNEKDYDNITQFSEVDGSIYLTGIINSNFNDVPDTYDLYKWDQNGTLTLIDSRDGFDKSSIKTASSSILDITDENDLIMHISIRYEKIEDLASKVTYIAKLKGEDFGLSTDTEDISLDHDVYLYPNPAKDILYLTKEISAYSISSYTGQVILTQKGQDRISSIDIHSLENGIYYLNTITQDGSSTTLPFVKFE